MQLGICGAQLFLSLVSFVMCCQILCCGLQGNIETSNSLPAGTLEVDNIRMTNLVAANMANENENNDTQHQPGSSRHCPTVWFTSEDRQPTTANTGKHNEPGMTVNLPAEEDDSEGLPSYQDMTVNLPDEENDSEGLPSYQEILNNQ